MLRKMKLFPKTFFYTLFMLLVITLSMHLMIYFFYPKVYISRMQSNLDKKLQVLQQSIQNDTRDGREQDFSDFARESFTKSVIDFTKVFDALGSNTVSTEWLTKLEKEHNLFPWLNYRIFCRKQ